MNLQSKREPTPFKVGLLWKTRHKELKDISPNPRNSPNLVIQLNCTLVVICNLVMSSWILHIRTFELTVRYVSCKGYLFKTLHTDDIIFSSFCPGSQNQLITINTGWDWNPTKSTSNDFELFVAYKLLLHHMRNYKRKIGQLFVRLEEAIQAILPGNMKFN